MTNREREAALLTRVNELELEVDRLRKELEQYKKQPTSILDMLKKQQK